MYDYDAEAEVRWRHDRMRELRESRGWSLFELAKRIDSQPSTLQKYEAGRTPPLEIALALTRVFGVSLKYLIDQSDDPMPPDTNNLPPGWQETVREAVKMRYGPDEALRALRAVRPLIEGDEGDK